MAISLSSPLRCRKFHSSPTRKSSHSPNRYSQEESRSSFLKPVSVHGGCWMFFRSISVPVYRWGLHDEINPLEEAIQKTIRDEFDVLMFTSAQQLAHVLQIAEKLGMNEGWLEHSNRCTVASIGPTTSQALKQAGLNVALEASPEKRVNWQNS